MSAPSPSSGQPDESRQTVPGGWEALEGMDRVTPSLLIGMFGKEATALQRKLREDQTCRIHVFDVAAESDTVIAEVDDILLEAPNWSVDGSTLYLNGLGVLWAVPLDAPSTRRRIDFLDLPAINNDHVLDPAGNGIYLSAMDGHIYRGSLDGGAVRRVTGEDDIWHFLHGISPDGATLGFIRIAVDGTPSRLAVIPAGGGAVTLVETGDGATDGFEFSPDGEWIYFNTERWAAAPGHAQLARVPADRPTAGSVERLISTDTVDWFPHLSPDGRLAVYLEFPEGTVGHPEDEEVHVVVVATSDWSRPLARIAAFGGQGTINVNSWSPDSTRFAFVSYPDTAHSEPIG